MSTTLMMPLSEGSNTSLLYETVSVMGLPLPLPILLNVKLNVTRNLISTDHNFTQKDQ